jgi:peptidoglycan lytic transglycosylase
VDAALIAAVIYEESKFRDQTSHAGARGLMQITPETARFIAHRSGGTLFQQGDLATPQINISYGAYYLRYLIDHYQGNETLAVAAYNAGQTNVDRWVRAAGGSQSFDPGADIPFPETRGYVDGVMKHRDDYRDRYASELGY